MQLHLHRTKRLKSESFEAQFFLSQIVLWTKISFEWSSNNISSNSNNQNAFKRSCITPTNATQATLCVHASLITDSHTVKPSDSLIVAKLIAELNLDVKATNNLKACRGTNDVELGASQNVGQSVKLCSTAQESSPTEEHKLASACIGTSRAEEKNDFFSWNHYSGWKAYLTTTVEMQSIDEYQKDCFVHLLEERGNIFL